MDVVINFHMPEDESDLLTCLAASKMYGFLFDRMNECRNKLKGDTLKGNQELIDYVEQEYQQLKEIVYSIED
jgi:hypothetical protein